MKYLKRTFNLLMAVVIVFNIAVNDYIVANATGVDVIVPTLSMLDSFLLTFGVSIGLGSQCGDSYYKRFESDFKAMSSGGTTTIDGYGVVDWSDSESIANYTEYVQKYTSSPALDFVSYKNTGTAASKALIDNVKNYVVDGSSALADEVQQCFQVITGGGGSNSGDEDPDKQPSDVPENWWNTVCAFASCLFLGMSDDDIFNEFSVPDDSVFNEYFVNGKPLTGYTGKYPFYQDSGSADSRKDYFGKYYVVGMCTELDSYANPPTSYFLYDRLPERTFILCNDTVKYQARKFDTDYADSSTVTFLTRVPDVDNKYLYNTYYNEGYRGVGFATNYRFYLPAFKTVEDARNFFLYDDMSGLLNNGLHYQNIISALPNPHAELAKPLANIKPADLPELAPKLYPIPSGVPETIPEAVEIIEDVVPQPDPTPVPNPDPTPIPDPEPGDGDSGKPTPEPDLSSKSFIDAILALLGILLMLLKIFLHLLEFIINIFKIPADPGFITGDFKLGFEYIKTVKLSPLNMSIYDFLMGLVHITIFFGVVKLLRQRIEKLQL